MTNNTPVITGNIFIVPNLPTYLRDMREILWAEDMCASTCLDVVPECGDTMVEVWAHGGTSTDWSSHGADKAVYAALGDNCSRFPSMIPLRLLKGATEGGTVDIPLVNRDEDGNLRHAIARLRCQQQGTRYDYCGNFEEAVQRVAA